MPNPALRCKDLVKRYGDTVAVAGLDLEVWRGECLGMLGPNGAGKTTTVVSHIMASRRGITVSSKPVGK